MHKYDCNAFIEALTKKLNNGILPRCPYCGGNRYTSPPEYANITISDSIGNIKIGPSVPAGMVVCENCGHIDFFALGVLDLLNNSEENTDGK